MTLISPYRKVAKLGKVGARSVLRPYKAREIPMFGGRVRQLQTTPPGLRRLVRRVGAERAKRIWDVQSRVLATIPEAIAFAWLEDRKYAFDFQSSQLGGLHVRGGAVVDFLIYNMSFEGHYIWRIQGEHWHTGGRKEESDRVQRDRLLGLYVEGAKVVAVVDLWENDLYDKWPRVLEMAEVGENIRYV